MAEEVLILFILLSIGALIVLFGITFLGASWMVCLFGGDLSDWVQSLGAILAIISGFAAAIWQVRAQRIEAQAEQRAIVVAAHILAYEALATASERLETALVPPNSGKTMTLQGDRTTEMVLAMREFDTTKLPASLLPHFVRIRSHVFAINERISDVYNSENKDEARKKERETRLKSAVRVLTKAIKLFGALNAKVGEFGAKPLVVEAGPNTTRVAGQIGA